MGSPCLFDFQPESAVSSACLCVCWLGKQCRRLTSALNCSAAPSAVKLWWPNGMGAQNLYGVHVSFQAGGAASPITADRRIGFRVFTLVSGCGEVLNLDRDRNILQTS